jgi:hypothetical protein
MQAVVSDLQPLAQRGHKPFVLVSLYTSQTMIEMNHL